MHSPCSVQPGLRRDGGASPSSPRAAASPTSPVLLHPHLHHLKRSTTPCQVLHWDQVRLPCLLVHMMDCRSMWLVRHPVLPCGFFGLFYDHCFSIVLKDYILGFVSVIHMRKSLIAFVIFLKSVKL